MLIIPSQHPTPSIWSGVMSVKMSVDLSRLVVSTYMWIYPEHRFFVFSSLLAFYGHLGCASNSWTLWCQWAPQPGQLFQAARTYLVELLPQMAALHAMLPRGQMRICCQRGEFLHHLNTRCILHERCKVSHSIGRLWIVLHKLIAQLEGIFS